MSHATDGQLEAHLDGALASYDPAGSDRLIAHLEACPDCRRRLEAARATRGRAGEILAGVLVSPVEVPPFEEIRARAGQSDIGEGPAGSGRRRGGRRFAPTPLAWAASVAIAVGAGWMGHAVWRGEAAYGGLADTPATSLEPRVGRVDPGDREAFRPSPATERPASVTEGAIAADEVAASETMAPEEAPETVRNFALGPEATPAEPGAVGGEYARRERAVALAPTERAETPAATPVAETPAATPAAETEGGAQEDQRENRPLAAARLAEADPPAALQQSAAKQAAAGARGRQDAEPGVSEARGVEVSDALAPGIDRDRTGETRWSEVGRPLAERWSGGPLLQVEGLPVDDYAIALRDGVELVRVGQSLPGGGRLELVYPVDSEQNEALLPLARLAPAEEAVETDEPSQASPVSLTVRVGSVSVTITAPVAADSLRVLGSRIR